MIHCYQFEGLNIVLDCYSGSIHMVDEVAYDMIQWYENILLTKLSTKAVSKARHHKGRRHRMHC